MATVGVRVSESRTDEPAHMDAPSPPDANGAPSGANEAPPGANEVLERAGGENFTVASVLLPKAERRHLLALYGFARLVDELGDSLQGDRLAALSWLEGELQAAYEGRATHPLMVALTPTLSACTLPAQPFLRLIEANRRDQRVSRYETWEQLQEYCELSANPVGELVLRVFGHRDEREIALSDRICTALQLIEHCQDVGEDLSAGRVYLPMDELRACGCGEDDLSQRVASPELRAVIALQMRRSRKLIAEGLPLVQMLQGRPKLAVAAYAAGGLAAVRTIERSGCDVLSGKTQASKGARLLALPRILSRRLGRGA